MRYSGTQYCDCEDPYRIKENELKMTTEKEKPMNQDEYDAERTANGDKRLINLLYEKIEVLQNDIVKQQEFVCQQQAEIEALNNAVDSLAFRNVLCELTDEKIKQIFRNKTGYEVDTCPSAILDFARAIERELKGEK
jgi:hypothetical protein